VPQQEHAGRSEAVPLDRHLRARGAGYRFDAAYRRARRRRVGAACREQDGAERQRCDAVLLPHPSPLRRPRTFYGVGPNVPVRALRLRYAFLSGSRTRPAGGMRSLGTGPLTRGVGTAPPPPTVVVADAPTALPRSRPRESPPGAWRRR